MAERSPAGTTTPSATPALLDLGVDQLAERLTDLGQPAYRAKQIWRAVHRRYATGFADMTDLPAALRTQLDAHLRIVPAVPIAAATSDDGSTSKTLLRLDDGELVETVLMRYDPFGDRRARKTVCVSTQAGCAMGCVFCATGAQGFRRQLTASEICAQVLVQGAVARADRSDAAGAPADVAPITNVVFMGMGEPLANYDATSAALQRLTDPGGFALAPRRITVSTVGLVPGIRRLAQDHPQVNLAVSLHAPNDDLRRRLVPVPAATIDDLLAAARDHAAATGRRVSFEYVLIDRINDRPAHAAELARLLRGAGAHVNLIPLNPSPGVVGARPRPAAVRRFHEILTGAGVPATVRQEKGRDILAACGQLRGDRPDTLTRSPV